MSADAAAPRRRDARLEEAMQRATQDVGQHNQWWQGMNNGMSKCWLMQDGHDVKNLRYSEVDSAPWTFVYECKESSLPVGALDVAFLFSPHSILNLRGAMVPTKMLMPRIDAGLDRGRWRIVGVLKKKKSAAAAAPQVVDDEAAESPPAAAESDGGEEDDDINVYLEPAEGGSEWRDRVIHDINLEDGGIPPLGNDMDAADLENISPVRIEAWMTKVFHYDGEQQVVGRVFCVVTVTPVRNMNLAEYLRTNVVENTQGNLFPGMSQSASENMRKDRKDMLHRILLEQMDLCGFFAQGRRQAEERHGIPDPLDALNMQGSDYYPGTYLCVPMAYKRIQNLLKRQGVDTDRMYVEGFSDTLNMVTGGDLLQAKRYSNDRALSFYAALNEYESLKPEERSGYCAKIVDANPPSWPWRGEPVQFSSRRRRGGGAADDDDDDVEDDDDGDGDGDDDDVDAQLLLSYTRRNRMPAIKICLLYNPLMYISPSASRSAWEQQLGGFPAFFIYTMSRSIYSSAVNPLLKPEYFMPEAKPMSTHERWMEHMDDGSNPLAGFFVAGWANRQFVRVVDACKQNTEVRERAKVEMLRDYLQTCFNMHLGLIDTKSLRSKTIYWSHRLMKDVDATVHHDLVRLLRDEMRIGGENFLGPRCTHQNSKALADGGYAQVSLLHVEAMNILNRDFFHLNDLNLSLLWRMLVTSTHHNIGIHNDKLSSMGSSMVACRGGGHYTGRWSAPGMPLGGGGGSGGSSSIAATYQALDKPNSVGGDLVVSHHAFFKSLNVINSASVRQFDNGQIPEDMTRFTEAGMRMISTVLVDEKNVVRSEPPDNLLSEYYMTEMQITNVELLKVLVTLLPRNMKMGFRGFSVDVSTIDANKTGERTTTRRLPVPGYSPHVIVIMTNMRAQQAEIKERFETAVIVMQRCFCGGQVDNSSGGYKSLLDQRKSGFGQYTWNSEKALGTFPKDTKNIAALFCTAYSASAYYVMMCNKHAMFSMELSPLCTGLCRWIESIFAQYLSHIYGRRQSRDMARTLEICKATACSETTINYTVLMMLRNAKLSAAVPHVMLCSLMDPIHIFEMPRMCYNVILNSVSLPIFFAISVFQREMEVPTLPLESVVEFLTNGKLFACCTRTRGVDDWRTISKCRLGADCHTKRVRDMLIRMLNHRAWLPKMSGVSLNFMSNATPYLTGYGDQEDRCDMSSHKSYGRSRPVSCMRSAAGRHQPRRAQQQQDAEAMPATAAGGGSSENEAHEACKMFARMCFQHYTKQFSECAMITESEFLQCMEEFMGMSTKFVQFFGDVPFFAQHETVLKNLGIPEPPASMHNISHKQAFEQGMPILQAKTFASGEIAIGIEWMSMLLMLAISGSARIDQQVGKNVAANLTATLFNKIPFGMFPYDAIQIKEFNPHMPCQEIIKLKDAAARPACIMRPNNRGVLDDGIPTQERILLPTCPLVPHLMLEDFGWASPYHSLCQTLGITSSVYDVPIDLVQWPVPYPVGVKWPVIEYGAGLSMQQRAKGYIQVVVGGGKTRLCLYRPGEQDEVVITLDSVHEAASVHRMGPRPLFCTPCRGVQLSESEVGVLVPVVANPEAEHPASRYFLADKDTFRVWSPAGQKHFRATHAWVETHILAMCSTILVKAWAQSMEKLVPHITAAPATAAELEEDRVHVMGKVVPPREVDSYSDLCIWVSIEVRHTIGYLKDTSYGDMITMKIPVQDLILMPEDRSRIVYYNRNASGERRRKKASSSSGSGSDAEGGQRAGGIVVCRFVYATPARQGAAGAASTAS